MPATNTTTQIPATMRAWVYYTTEGGIENAMKLVPDYPVPESFRTLPTPPPGKGDETILVRVLAASINPVDHKLPELPLVGGFLQKKPTTPAVDFCGRVVRTSNASSTFRPGQLVAGKLPSQTQHGALAEYAVAHSGNVAPVPAGVSVEQAATIGICGSTVWSSLVPDIEAAKKAGRGKDGLRVFINGGSGGIGSFAVPIAKALGCQVTTTCSTKNVEHVRQTLGADDVIDYRTTNVGDALIQKSKKDGQYDVALDAVGMPFGLYKAADKFLVEGAPFTRITMDSIADGLRVALQPTFLGGGKHSAPFVNGKPTPEGLRSLLDLMVQGKLKVPLDGDAPVPFTDVPRAYARLKTNRARGKIVIHVADDN
ncbi:putative secondary metabolism biosynthetic enzyme [Sporothrix eucalyptigena]|uniref:Secondary metabolism biosynthetic enzyme n=1 Tax=Sporothrix eucalyptigena TaxID=1812306 RepID=A0ABP0AX60_9PEZI